MQKDRHLSYSQIQTYLQCPYLWGLQNYKGLKPEGKSDALLLGGALHETIAKYTNWYLKTGFDHGFETLKGFWYTVSNDVEICDLPVSYSLYEKGKVILETWFNSEGCELDHVDEIEQRLEVDFGEGIQIVAILDRVDNYGGGNYRITDYKTRGFHTSSTLAENLQLQMYAAALWLALKGEISSLVVAISVLDSGQVTEMSVTEADVFETIKYVVNVGQRIYGDTKLTANPGEACLKWGGCWGAYACREHQQTLMVTRDTTIDLASASDQELVKWYNGLKYCQQRVTSAMKERLTGGAPPLVYHNTRVSLEPLYTKDVNERVLNELFADFGEFGLTPFSMMNIDKRKITSVVRRVTQNILDTGAMSATNQQHYIQVLEERMANVFSERQSGTRFTTKDIKQK